MTAINAKNPKIATVFDCDQFCLCTFPYNKRPIPTSNGVVEWGVTNAPCIYANGKLQRSTPDENSVDIELFRRKAANAIVVVPSDHKKVVASLAKYTGSSPKKKNNLRSAATNM